MNVKKIDGIKMHSNKSIYLAQNGEDILIQSFINILKDETKWCVEFGAWDGLSGSNTHYFITQENYKAVLIEGDEKKYQDLIINLQAYPVNCFNTFVSFEGLNSLDNILAQTNIPKDFTFLVIDIDGNDYYMWQSLETYRPKLVVIEFNPSISNELEFVQEKNMSLNQGCSPLALVNLAKQKGYELIGTTLNNAFFVDKQYFPLFNIEDNALCKLRTNLSKVTYLFNGYDGHIFIRGYSKLDLYSMPYDEKRMQLIPAYLQGWNIQNPFKRLLQRIHRSLRKRNIL